MKVDIVKTHRVHLQGRQGCQQTALLPVIDAWYAYKRTPAAIHLFNACPEEENLTSKLIESLSRTLNLFPHYAGTLQPYVNKGEHGKGKHFQRTRVVWGGDEPGSEFIEARTMARVQTLLPPSVRNTSAFLWDRTGSSLRSLFPDTASATSGVRVQMTTFRCGGFSIGIDFDHGLADANCIGLFIRYWSATYNQLFHPEKYSAEALPDVLFKPQFLKDKVPTIEEHKDPNPILLQKARELPTRRPDFRGIGEHDSPKAPNIVSTAVQERSTGVSCLLHIPAFEYEQITRRIQDEASVQVTDQLALVGFLWAALNRARALTRYPVGLHLAASLRWKLGVPEGLLGCMGLAVMITGSKKGESFYTDPAKLAVEITTILNKYDEDALLAIIYDASLRDSPTSAFRPTTSAERMEFTSVAQFGTSNLSFGSNKPVFFAPLLSVDNLFVMVEGLPTAAAIGNKWYKDGVSIFFSLPQDVFEALMSDPAFTNFEMLPDI